MPALAILMRLRRLGNLGGFLCGVELSGTRANVSPGRAWEASLCQANVLHLVLRHPFEPGFLLFAQLDFGLAGAIERRH